MKKIILFMAIIPILCVSSFSIAADGDYTPPKNKGPSPDNVISMDFQDVDLKTVLKVFSQQAGMNFIASQNVRDRTVTIYFDDVKVEDALSYIMDANNLVYEKKPGSNIFIVKETGSPTIETVTKIYELKYAQLTPPPKEEGSSEQSGEPEILSLVENLVSPNGKVLVNKRSNSLIITDVPSQFGIIEDVLSSLDVRTPQVMIEAEIVETSTTVADQLGMDWTGTFGVYAGPVHGTVWPMGNFSKDTPDIGEGITEAGSVSMSGMGVTLSALLSNSDTRILARPKVLTLNNEKAIIELTAETAVASVTTVAASEGTATQGTDTAERIDTGITLEVTPQINKDGYITMHIEPTVTIPVLSKFFSGASGGTKFVDPQTRSTKSTVRVKDGETIVIGGLISREDTYSLEKIPFLGDIPILGMAFRYKTKDNSDKELIVFITPHIIKETSYALRNISEREQERPKADREKEISNLLDLLGR